MSPGCWMAIDERRQSRVRDLAQDRYKVFNGYREHGLEALSGRSRRPMRYANQLPPQIERLIVECNRNKPHWAPATSASCWLGVSTATFACPPRALSTPFLIATASSSASADAIAPITHRCPRVPHRTITGVPILRRVLARQWPLLLSAHGHRPCFAFPIDVRSHRSDPRRPRNAERPNQALAMQHARDFADAFRAAVAIHESYRSTPI